MMVKITNKSDIKQPVHTVAGVVFIHPGHSRDVELSEPGEKLVEKSDTLDTSAKRARKSTRKPVDAETDQPGDECSPQE